MGLLDGAAAPQRRPDARRLARQHARGVDMSPEVRDAINKGQLVLLRREDVARFAQLICAELNSDRAPDKDRRASTPAVDMTRGKYVFVWPTRGDLRDGTEMAAAVEATSKQVFELLRTVPNAQLAAQFMHVYVQFAKHYAWPTAAAAAEGGERAKHFLGICNLLTLSVEIWQPVGFKLGRT